MTARSDLEDAADALARSMEAEQAQAERHALELVNIIAALNIAIRPQEAEKAKAVDALKQYMTLRNLSVLEDAETGRVAKITDRESSPLYDLVSLAKAGNMGILADAALAGLLRVDHVALKRFRDGNGASWLDELWRYQMPGSTTVVLTVSEGDRR